MSGPQFFSIKRPLDKSSVSAIKECLDLSQAGGAVRRDELKMGQTMVEARFITQAYQRKSPNSTIENRHAIIFSNLAASVLRTSEFDVDDVTLLGRRSDGLHTLALKLDDKTDQLRTEHSRFLDRMPLSEQQKELSIAAFRPHISLGIIATSLATSELFDSIYKHAPSTITLAPTTSSTPNFLPRHIQMALLGGRPENYTHPVSSPKNNPTIPELSQITLPHPGEFLQTLGRTSFAKAIIEY